MASIRIEQLSVGFDLIADTETYLDEITDTDLDLTKGGLTPVMTTLIAFSAGYGVGKAISEIIH
ncbi:hypothetical protein B6N60_01022 [Richelia sinica FACHB-800]|uniref:Uncharacterized protein n=1 Tax=Richelia sinica FACHB-800 TaxID=1357546 RepID=A0A975T580_9NOST|nr:hypothetical protein [Richelia sinica]MBD2664909.1 hypothetical protein [Richelia sinica FACHB-800]QXE22339.1 hypothetical protein B6N60_01022 [Richelia sinica FACHB-800]